jgi:UDP-N-acetylglucosamine 2-epimerase (non-hydrolysing)
MTGALAASNLQIKVAHVEAGLRTWNKHSPFPEENYRRIISAVADWHFAATPKAADNLQNEGYTGIFVTGNTAIDALHSLDVEPAQFKRKTALLTLHRRENWGEPMRRLLEEIGEAAEEFDFDVVFPMHPNPAFQELTKNLNSKIGFTPAMSYFTFVATMKGVDFILTDSGGVQEEAPTYNKPVIVLRDTTERSEGLGTHAVLARPGEIKSAIESIRNIQFQGNPYGDGYAAKRIATYLGIPPAQTREIDADYVPRSQDIHLD